VSYCRTGIAKARPGALNQTYGIPLVPHVLRDGVKRAGVDPAHVEDVVIGGEENIHIMDALAQSRIRFVTKRHEQGAAFMADVCPIDYRKNEKLRQALGEVICQS
jgi:acetyl-CoA acetyltransferase